MSYLDSVVLGIGNFTQLFLDNAATQRFVSTSADASKGALRTAERARCF